jgi:hypothetical protein
MADANEATTETTTEGYNHEAAPDNEATQGLNYEDSEGFSFNMKDEQASSGYPLIPIGTYDATCEDAQYKISQNSGNPMWQLKWAVPVSQDGKEKVMKITSFVVFSPEQRGRAKMFLKRVAPELAELEDFNPKTLASQITGKPARLKINHQKGQDDEPRANVADVLAPAAGGAGGGFSL